MKKFAVFFLVLMIVFSVSGQQKKGQVYLKNGSVIKGKVLASDSPEEIRIESAGNLWVFKLNEIDKIAYAGTRVKTEKIERPFLGENFYCHTEGGLLLGNSDNSQSAPFFLQSSLNYRITPKLAAGIGAGVDFLKETNVPVFANFEYRFRTGSFSPFVFFQGGYSFSADDSNTIYPSPIYYNDAFYYNSYYPWYYSGENLKAKGGILFNPGAGFVSMLSENFGVSFSLGYRFSRLSYKGDDDYRLDVDFNRLSLKLGIIFN